MDQATWMANSVIALLAALGLISGCWLFLEWAKGTFKQEPVDPDPYFNQMASYERAAVEREIAAHDDRAAEREQACFEALVRVEAIKMIDSQLASQSHSPVEMAPEAATTPTTPPEPSVDPREAERERVRAEAMARVAARVAETTSCEAQQAEQAAAAERQAEEIRRRAEKARPRPGVRSIREYDFNKELRDDIPRAQQFIDPLDSLPGYR